MIDSLGDILKKRVNNSPLWNGVRAALVIEQGDKVIGEIIGPAALEFAKCAYYKNGILAIASLSSAIAQEIKLNETRIVAKINQNLGAVAIDKIRYLA